MQPGTLARDTWSISASGRGHRPHQPRSSRRRVRRKSPRRRSRGRSARPTVRSPGGWISRGQGS
eukprot:1917473-Pyramimonas_sp.AAC.1